MKHTQILIAALLIMNTYADDRPDIPNEHKLLIVPPRTPEQEATSAKMDVLIKDFQAKQKQWQPSKKLDDIIGAGATLEQKQRVYTELSKLEWMLHGAANEEQAQAARAFTLEHISNIVPGVSLERLGKLLKLKKEELVQP